jgi:hypothetical protein
MQSISTISLGIAKSVLQMHGVDAAGTVVVRKRSAVPQRTLGRDFDA